MGGQGRVFEHFVVCGLGPEMQATDGRRGFHGTSLRYMPSLLDQFPPPSSPSPYPPPPPQLPLCVLPAGVEFYSAGPSTADESSYPRSYPIVLTDGDGSKFYVGCVAFRDPVDDDVAQAYRIPPNSFVDKCICVVSHTPCFQVFRDALEELHHLCFSASGCSKPLWDIIAHMVSHVPLPHPGQGQVLFALENYLLSVEVPTKDDLPHADLSFQPLLQCLDIGNAISLFTAILLEKRVLLRASKYSLLTLVAEAICHLIYPIKWQHVYIPVLFYAGVDYIDAPTPYLMGLHSGVDTSDLTMDGVVVVDLDHNKITSSEDIPPIPEPELGQLKMDLIQLLHPNLKDLDNMRYMVGLFQEPFFPDGSKPWSRKHDLALRLIFLKFFASILSEYRNFVENSAANVFNKEAFLKKRSRMTNLPVDPIMDQFLGSQGFFDFLERGYGSAQAGRNLMDKLQDATKKGQPATAILPLPSAQPEILTVSDSSSRDTASRSRYSYDRFPASARTQAQEERRKAALAAASALLDRPIRHNSSPSQIQSVAKAESLSPIERAAERDRMVLDIKVKLQGLWLRLLQLGATEDPLSSFEYGTILALIESDAEGIGGSGFIECIGEHIHFGWDCLLSQEQFVAVKELMKTTVNRAISRRDILTVRAALEYSALIYRKDTGNIRDYIQRYLGALPVWDEEQFWEAYFDSLIEKVSDKSGNYSTLVAEHLILIAHHMVGLSMADAEAWFIMELIAQKYNLGSKQLFKLRGMLTYLQQIRQGYWGLSADRAQTLGSFIHGLRQHKSRTDDENQPPAEAAGAGRSWVQSMFSRDRAALATGQGRRARSEGNISVPNHYSQNATQPKVADASNLVQKRGSSGVRTLRAHKASVTALHVAVKSEAGISVLDHDDSGYFISGSADCTVKIWNPISRGSELRATLQGHTRSVRAITSDKVRIVSGSDDQRVLVWDKNTGQLLEELKGHDGTVTCVQMLSDPCVLTASHDGSVRMWDVRTDTCVATVCRTSSAILCMKYDHTTKNLAAAGVDGMVNVWDTRAGKQRHKLLGHTKWIRCLSMAGDTIVTGSDDWTAKVWTISRGTCDATLVCHGGAITCVEYCPSDRGIVTGSSDGMVRLWESEEGILRCVKNVGIHNSAILSLKAGEKWLAIGAADNSMSLFHRPDQRTVLQNSSGHRMAGWQLYRTPQRTAAIVRCVASDPDRGRICSGSRNGLLRLWEPAITV